MWLCGEDAQRWYILDVEGRWGAGVCVTKFLSSSLLLPQSAIHSFPPFIAQSTIFPSLIIPLHGNPFSALINAFYLSPPARFPPPHKQDLFLIDVSCSTEVTPPPPNTNTTSKLLHSTFLLLSLTSSLPPCSFDPSFSCFLSCPARI